MVKNWYSKKLHHVIENVHLGSTSQDSAKDLVQYTEHTLMNM